MLSVRLSTQQVVVPPAQMLHVRSFARKWTLLVDLKDLEEPVHMNAAGDVTKPEEYGLC